MSRLFVLVQHGSHAQLRDFDLLRQKLVQHFRLHPHLNTTNTNNNNTKKAKNLESATSFPSSPTFWGTSANEGLGTDAGTHKCVDNIMLELTPELRKFISSRSASSERLYFSAVGHSFGGLLLREVVYRIHTNPALKDIRDALTFLTFCSFCSPHCGVTSINPLLRWGGRLLGQIYSTTYAELLLDAPLLQSMATHEQKQKQKTTDSDGNNIGHSSSYVSAWSLFQKRLLVGCWSHDYLVKYETATLMPIGAVDPEKHARLTISSYTTLTAANDDDDDTGDNGEEQQKQKQQQSVHNNNTNAAGDDDDDETTARPQRTNHLVKKSERTSTHVGKTIPLLKLTPPAADHQQNNNTQHEQQQQGFSQLDEQSQNLALSLRRHMDFEVMPVFIPKEHEWFCIAHDAVLGKGPSAGCLPDVVDAVVERLVEDFVEAERDVL